MVSVGAAPELWLVSELYSEKASPHQDALSRHHEHISPLPVEGSFWLLSSKTLNRVVLSAFLRLAPRGGSSSLTVQQSS